MRTLLLIGLLLALASSSADARRRHHYQRGNILAPQGELESDPLRAVDPRLRDPRVPERRRCGCVVTYPLV